MVTFLARFDVFDFTICYINIELHEFYLSSQKLIDIDQKVQPRSLNVWAESFQECDWSMADNSMLSLIGIDTIYNSFHWRSMSYSWTNLFQKHNWFIMQVLKKQTISKVDTTVAVSSQSLLWRIALKLSIISSIFLIIFCIFLQKITKPFVCHLWFYCWTFDLLLLWYKFAFLTLTNDFSWMKLILFL